LAAQPSRLSLKQDTQLAALEESKKMTKFYWSSSLLLFLTFLGCVNTKISHNSAVHEHHREIGALDERFKSKMTLLENELDGKYD
jgi:hypothetical protein